MFVGIISLRKERPVNDHERSALRKVLSRVEEETIYEYNDPNACLLRVNLGGLNQNIGLLETENHCVSLLAGEPLFDDRIASPNNEHERLHQAIYDCNLKEIAFVNGVFCAALYSITDKGIRLSMCSDKLGIRPLYYYAKDGIIAFSTAIRMLEALPFLKKSGDFKGISEIVGFGFALGDRTPYEDIHLLREAQILCFDHIGKTSKTYWKWDQIPVMNSGDEVLENAYSLFKKAIKRRLRDDSKVLAFLSGGMDSRAIVASLADMKISAQTFNFSPDNSQDQVYAYRFAKEIGCDIKRIPSGEKYPQNFRLKLAQYMYELSSSGHYDINRPRTVWSGDGGSVSVGCVYLNEDIINIYRQKRQREAIDQLLSFNHWSLPYKVMERKRSPEARKLLQSSVEEELKRLNCDDPGQELFLFLMFNDQRRHLHDVYEDNDLHRLEYQLPFFDSTFLGYLFGVPLDERIYHRFYNRWFGEFPAETRTVPWQTYPGHRPCPLAVEENLKYQWERNPPKFTERIPKRIDEFNQMMPILLNPKAISPISRNMLALSALIHLFGIRDYRYLFKAVRMYQRYQML